MHVRTYPISPKTEISEIQNMWHSWRTCQRLSSCERFIRFEIMVLETYVPALLLPHWMTLEEDVACY